MKWSLPSTSQRRLDEAGQEQSDFIGPLLAAANAIEQDIRRTGARIR